MCADQSSEFAFAKENRLNAGISVVKVSTEPFGSFKYDIPTDIYLDTDTVIQYYFDIIMDYQTENIYDPEASIGAKDLYLKLMTKNGPTYVVIGDDEFFDAIALFKEELFI